MNKPLIAITTSICSIVTTIAIMSMTSVVSAQSNNYDVNRDGKISIMDMIALKRFILDGELQDDVTQDLVTVTFENSTLHGEWTVAAGVTIINNTNTNLVIEPICTKVNDSTGKTYIGVVDMGICRSSTLEPCSITYTTVVICPLSDINDIHTIEIEFMCYNRDTAEFVTHIEPITLYINKEVQAYDRERTQGNN